MKFRLMDLTTKI